MGIKCTELTGQGQRCFGFRGDETLLKISWGTRIVEASGMDLLLYRLVGTIA